jgi:hypothetical protein
MEHPDPIKPIKLADARTFMERWHYKASAPTGRNICFGWHVAGELYAVAIYGDCSALGADRHLAKATGLPVATQSLIELRRLARAEPKRDDYPLTRFMSICHRMLRHEHGKQFVVSYSDAAQGHEGGIYKAANFQKVGRAWFLDLAARFRKGDHYYTGAGELIGRRKSIDRQERRTRNAAHLEQWRQSKNCWDGGADVIRKADLEAVTRPVRCENCGNWYPAARSDSKTCTPKCRVALHRKRKRAG